MYNANIIQMLLKIQYNKIMDIKEIRKDLGQRIKAFRTHNNYTQEQFCEIIDLEQPNLSNIENGKNLPDIKTLFSMLENGRIEPNFLFGFFNKNFEQYTPLDYEIIDLIKDLPVETKILIKNCLKLIK